MPQETNPRTVSADVFNRLRDIRPVDMEAFLKTTLRPELLEALCAEDAAGVSAAAGMLHGVIQKAGFVPMRLQNWLASLDIDFYSMHQLVKDAVTQHGRTPDLRAALAMLDEMERTVLLASPTPGGDAYAQMPVQGWQNRAPRLPRAASATTGDRHARSALPDERDDDIHLNLSTVHTHARRLAQLPTPGGRAQKAGVIIAADVFIPTAHLTPHIHIAKDFVAFKKADGSHHRLTEGDVLNVQSLRSARRSLSDDGLAYNQHMLSLLDYLGSE